MPVFSSELASHLQQAVEQAPDEPLDDQGEGTYFNSLRVIEV